MDFEKKPKFDLKHEASLALTKIIVIAVVGIACTVAVLYCTHIYYDREAALHDALLCTRGVMEQQGLTSWITNGTLLGSVRLGRFVMWDGELDVAVLNAPLLSSTNGNDDDALLRPTIAQLESVCFPYSSSVQGTAVGQPRRWRLCNSRVCAEIHEFIAFPGNNTLLWSIDGIAPRSQVTPLVECTVQGIAIGCPANATFFLDAAYGSSWSSGSLTALF